MAIIPWTGAWLSGGYSAIATNLDKRSSLIHGTGTTDTNNSVNQPGDAFLYVTGAQVPTWGVPMTQAEARTNGWLLHDSTGAEIPITNNSSGLAANIASTAYANQFLADLRAYLTAHPGNEGVYFDNFIIDFDNFASGKTYPLYDQAGNVAIANQTAWANAQVQFISIVGAGLIADGKRVAVNGKAFISGQGAYNFGDASNTWLDRFSAYITDYQIEYWQETGSALNPTTFVDNTSQGYTGNWVSWQGVHSHCNTIGVNFWGFSYGKAVDTQHARYLKASFLMEVARAGSAFIWADGGSGTDNWNSIIAIDPGAAQGSKTTFANGVQKRVFANYTVYCNPKTVDLVADGITVPTADAVFLATGAPGTSFPTTPILDTFDGGTIGANWVQSNMSAAGGALAPTTATASIYWNAAAFNAKQESYLTVTTLQTADLSHYFAFQMQHEITAVNIYEIRIYGTGLTNIYKVTAGAYSGVLANVTQTLHAGDSFGVFDNGAGRIDVYQQTGGVWALVLRYQDPSSVWTQSGKLRYVISGSTGVFDNLGGGNSTLADSPGNPKHHRMHLPLNFSL